MVRPGQDGHSRSQDRAVTHPRVPREGHRLVEHRRAPPLVLVERVGDQDVVADQHVPADLDRADAGEPHVSPDQGSVADPQPRLVRCAAELLDQREAGALEDQHARADLDPVG